MILMWLGSIGVLLVGLSLFRRSISEAGASLQAQFLNLSENETSVFKMLFVTKMCALSCGGLLRAQYDAMALINTKTLSRRYAILLLCLSSTGLWTSLLAGLSLWWIQWSVFVGIAVLCYLIYFWFGAGRLLFKILFGFGLILLGAQLALRDQSILLSLLGESELHYLLADGRFFAQFVWLVISFVITLVLGVESWSVFFCITLLSAGSLSLNGAVAFVAGELLAHFWMLYWRSRKFSDSTRKLARNYALVSTVGIFAGFVVSGVLRVFDMNDVANKKMQFMAMFFSLIVCQVLAAMVWGHFTAQKSVAEVEAGVYFSKKWVWRGLMSQEVFCFILKKLKGRQALLFEQKKSLTSVESAKIPKGVLKSHEDEILNLESWIAGISDQGRENC